MGHFTTSTPSVKGFCLTVKGIAKGPHCFKKKFSKRVYPGRNRAAVVVGSGEMTNNPEIDRRQIPLC